MLDTNSTILGVDTKTWMTGGAIVLLVALAHLGLRLWARWRAQRHRRKPLTPGETLTARNWIARGLSEAIPPIAFMLWLHGLYVAATMLLSEHAGSLWVTRGLTLLGWVRGFGTLLGLAWLLVRIARTIDKALQSYAS